MAWPLAEALGRAPVKAANGCAQSTLAVWIFEWAARRSKMREEILVDLPRPVATLDCPHRGM